MTSLYNSIVLVCATCIPMMIVVFVAFFSFTCHVVISSNLRLNVMHNMVDSAGLVNASFDLF